LPTNTAEYWAQELRQSSDKVRQVVLNLLSNAIKFTPDRAGSTSGPLP
jgi:signal transduction histidine kinase